MRDPALVALYGTKAREHIRAFTSLYELPYTVEIGPFSATILTLDVGEDGDLIVTLTWALHGVPQVKPDGGVQTWVVTNPPVYVRDPLGTFKINGIKHRLDPLYIAKTELGNLLQMWAAL